MTVSEVYGRHGLPPSVLYRWRAVAQGDSTVALKREAQLIQSSVKQICHRAGSARSDPVVNIISVRVRRTNNGTQT